MPGEKLESGADTPLRCGCLNQLLNCWLPAFKKSFERQTSTNDCCLQVHSSDALSGPNWPATEAGAETRARDRNLMCVSIVDSRNPVT